MFGLSFSKMGICARASSILPRYGSVYSSTNKLSNLILYCDKACRGGQSLVGLGPNGRTCTNVDELSRNAYLISDPSEAADKGILCLESAAQLRNVYRFVFISKGRVPREQGAPAALLSPNLRASGN